LELSLIVARYFLGGIFPVLEQNAEYDVLTVDIPVKVIAFLRVVGASGEDCLYRLTGSISCRARSS
jgi:hypothetical protein